MNTTQPAIIASSLTVIKSKRVILNDLSFTVQPGTITGLVGPSGSGKTTLMRAIVGVQAITDGSLTVLGARAGRKQLRRAIGYVSQTPSVYGDLTVMQNLKYFATIAGAPRAAVETVITDVDLMKQRDQVVGSLSGGQRARVSLAVALLGDPELLVLDEPTVGLDPVLRESLWELFRQLADSGKTLLVSSHVMDEAQRCEQLLLLRDGALLWNDSRVALLKKTGQSDVGRAFIAAVKEGER